MYQTGGVSLMGDGGVKGCGPEVRLPGCKPQRQVLLIWASYWASAFPGFCIPEVRMIMALHRITVRIKLDITDVKHFAQSLARSKYLIIVRQLCNYYPLTKMVL